jgi:hypothetical protein
VLHPKFVTAKRTFPCLHRACVEQVLKHSRISFPFTQHVHDADSMGSGMKFDARPDGKSGKIRGTVFQRCENWFEEFGCQQARNSTRSAIVRRPSECGRWKPRGTLPVLNNPAIAFDSCLHLGIARIIFQFCHSAQSLNLGQFSSGGFASFLPTLRAMLRFQAQAGLL